MIDSETPISGVQLGDTPIPLKIKASNINSENATEGQALLADGQGGAEWGDVQEKLNTTNVQSGTIDESIGFDNLGNVVRGSAGGGQFYIHHIYASFSSYAIYFEIITKNPNTYNFVTFRNFLYDAGYSNPVTKAYYINCIYGVDYLNNFVYVPCIWGTSTQLKIKVYTVTNSVTVDFTNETVNSNFTSTASDYVISSLTDSVTPL